VPRHGQLLGFTHVLTNHRQQALFFLFQEIGLDEEEGDDFPDELPLGPRNHNGVPQLFMEAHLQVFQPGQQGLMPSRIVPGRGQVRYERQDVLVLGFLMVAERHGPAVKIVQEGFKVPPDLEVFGSLARPSCLRANRFMDEIHDINGVIELGDFGWHGATPSRRNDTYGAGAASGGAVSTQVLARRRGRDSPQSQLNIACRIYTRALHKPN
jgi:hypothetical protein